jgi:hypothetical protein
MTINSVLYVIKDVSRPYLRTLNNDSLHMAYKCPRCNYETCHKGTFKRHLERTILCNPSDKDNPVDRSMLNALVLQLKDNKERNYPCERCGRACTSPQAKYSHKKTCVVKTSPENTPSQQTVTTNSTQSASTIVNNQGTINNNTTTTTNSHNTTIININNVTLKGLGEEDIQYITTHPNFEAFMMKCIKERHTGLCNYITTKHFNPKHVHNHNIRCVNKKHKLAEKYDGRKWTMDFMEDVTRTVFELMESDFRNFLNNTFNENNPMNIHKRSSVDDFMTSVGIPLDWNLDCDSYEYESDDVVTEKYKEAFRNKMYVLASEHIYKQSKQLAQSSKYALSQMKRAPQKNTK